MRECAICAVAVAAVEPMNGVSAICVVNVYSFSLFYDPLQQTINSCAVA